MPYIGKILRNIIVTAVAVTVGIAAQAQGTKPGEGEVLYRGIVKLEKCDEAIISFVLSAKADTLKNFSFELNGIYIKGVDGSLKKVTSQSTYSAAVAVTDGVVDYTYPWRGENWRISIKKGLGTETAHGEIKCVYVVGNSQIEDLGTAPVEFKKIETVQE
jgi:hypothetical protein